MYHSPISPSLTKRHRDEDEEFSPKRNQLRQIFSETHLSTVNMMMQALRQQKQFPIIEEDIEAHCPEPEEFKPQRPFWPEINRIRGN